MNTHQVLVLGSGPGGYVAAIRAAQLGFNTAIVEKYTTLGGTCLNVGCIPSKALLDSSEHFFNAVHKFKDHGIETNAVKVNMQQMLARKAAVIQQTCEGINYLMKKNKITVYQGTASFVSKNQVQVQGEKETRVLTAEKIIIATGSKPNYFPGMQPDKKRILTSTEALNLAEVTKKMLLIGAGVIGLELGSVFARLGTQIEVVEFADKPLPTMDASLGKEMQKVLQKEGFTFHFQHQVKEVKNTGDAVTLTALNASGETITLTADYCLVAVGRKPYTEGLHLAAAGITVDAKGFIPVDAHLQTQTEGIYAIGDVIGGWMLAHKASEEGVYVAERLAGQKPHINYNLIPGVVYTWPEVASVGKTEEQLKAEGAAYKVGNFPFKALGRARASTDVQGFVKILSDKTTDEVLGVHILGARAADLIMEAVVAMEYRATAEDISRICHPHPTFSEAVREAALDATAKIALHI